jgi:hypothetical protein
LEGERHRMAFIERIMKDVRTARYAGMKRLAEKGLDRRSANKKSL